MKEYDELDFSYISSDYYCPRQLNLTSYNLYFHEMVHHTTTCCHAQESQVPGTSCLGFP